MEIPSGQKVAVTKKSTAKKQRAIEPELTGVGESLPDKNAVAYDTFAEVDHRETKEVGTAPLTAFVSKHKGLRLKVRPLVVDHIDGEEYYKTSTINFIGGVFSSTDASLIDALRRHANYGGGAGKQYEDRPRGAREPLFWEGAYPADVASVRREEEQGLTKDPEQYDPGSER